MNTKNETKRTPDIQSDIAPEQGLLNIKFRHGKELNLLVSELAEEIRNQALLHGLKQKLVDAAAISRNPETGRTATIEDKFDAVKEVFDRLLAGEWNKTRAGGGNAGGLLLQALIRLYPGKTAEELREFVGKLTRAQQAALRANALVAPIIAEIQAERGGDAADDLLAELEADNGDA